MQPESNLTERLRDRIVSALHVGRIHAGDRLPSIREVALETGVNPRTVAKAYRELEREGLVEVRGRSGVYLARQDHWGGKLLAETGRWLGGVLLEAWKRHIPIPDLAELIRGCTRAVRIRAACLAGNEDLCHAICAELESAFGIGCTPASAADLPTAHGKAAEPSAELRTADLIVTTPFLSAPVRRAAEVLDKPVVTVTLHPDYVAAIERRLEEGTLIVVCVDPAFGEQVRAVHAGEFRDRVRVVLASDAEAIASLDPDEPVLLTRAAQERLGNVDITPLAPLAPFISPESAREIAELMIRLHMEAEHGEK